MFSRFFLLFVKIKFEISNQASEILKLYVSIILWWVQFLDQSTNKKIKAGVSVCEYLKEKAHIIWCELRVIS